MKIAVLSDIHANWQALAAVVDDASDVQDFICLGDVVGYGGDPIRCVDEVRTRLWPTLVGNHDRACSDELILSWFNGDAAEGIRWTQAQLGEERLQWLKELPETGVRQGVLLVHASPRDPTFEYILDATTARANLNQLESTICFHGHSHIPGIFHWEQGRVRHDYRLGTFELAGPQLVNPGSVGQPRDGITGASYGVWDIDEAAFEFRRVEYDRAAAKLAIRQAGLPERFAERLDLGL
ncbi:MAG: metallophosphoesterase family protein [Candidatus Dormibacteraceae bacterium]